MTALPQTVEVRITREFDAPIEAVFRAWTVPAELAAWYGPAQFDTPEDKIRIDLRKGGRYELTMVRRDTGEEMPAGYEILELEDPTVLVLRSDPDARVRDAGARDHACAAPRPRRPHPHGTDRRALPRGLRARRDRLELIVRPTRREAGWLRAAGGGVHGIVPVSGTVTSQGSGPGVQPAISSAYMNEAKIAAESSPV